MFRVYRGSEEFCFACYPGKSPHIWVQLIHTCMQTNNAKKKWNRVQNRMLQRKCRVHVVNWELNGAVHSSLITLGKKLFLNSVGGTFMHLLPDGEGRRGLWLWFEWSVKGMATKLKGRWHFIWKVHKYEVCLFYRRLQGRTENQKL